MVVGEGDQNLVKVYHELHTVLCPAYVTSFGKFVINMKWAKDTRDSIVWFPDMSGFNNEHAFSHYFRNSPLLIGEIKCYFQTNHPQEVPASTFAYTPSYIYICISFWRPIQHSLEATEKQKVVNWDFSVTVNGARI